MQHHLWQLTWDGELCMCPKKNGANRVLDIGTGTGIWAMDYAEEHPEAKVIGVDLTPIQSGYNMNLATSVPSNCVFEIDDVEKEWTWSAPFDFVFLRHMNSSFASWEKVIAQAYSRFKDLLVNAGFEEVVEVKRIWPMNGWTKNEKLRELGSWSQACSLKGCEASALALFTNVLGWTREEVLVFCSGVRRDLNNTGIHAYWNIYSTFGKKPLKANTSQDE
ncbi:methyltransferase domain-containing protein [Colletotrichum karsti]|uniref:Methyltransferase domain-containing protein n=1 Tax=Colletotrichum karsti TaxID=1095194 RepID=A0A9P6IGH1_9PEZI|nr:methyltransferase domain-containing protein [Colletotrichum karsti]KAF9878365.1 methyltransferase domain-containing protein [Colletotrichum karsti]